MLEALALLSLLLGPGLLLRLLRPLLLLLLLA
jgi:hypothetical protein